MRRAEAIMSLDWSPLKFVLEEADEAKRQGDNCKAEALISIAYDILDKHCGDFGQSYFGGLFGTVRD